MSLNSILSNAVSGLNTAQTALRTTSSNITNVNTPNYARRVTDIQTRVLAGQGAGVEIADIRRVVDEFLVGASRTAGADGARYSIEAELHDRLQALLGDPSGQNTLTSHLDNLFSSLFALTNDPSSSVRRSGVLNAIESFGQAISRLSGDLQSLRTEAERQISGDLGNANRQITRIYDLNREIRLESLAGHETSALEDQRDSALADLGKIVDISTFKLSNGAVGVSTSSGIVLVDDVARQFVYSGPGLVGPETIFPEIQLQRVDPATGALTGVSFAIDRQIQSGSLRGYLNMRDQVLPDISAELGELARRLGNQLNAIHNQYTAVPPANTLTGHNCGLDATDLQNFTGSATFYAFDANDNIAAQTTIDFSALAPGSTVGDIIAAVNAGLAGAATLSLTNGVLSFTAGTASGVGIADGAPPSDRGGQDFSLFFGLNDLVTASGAFTYNTGVAAGDPHNFSGAATFVAVGPNNEKPVTYTLDFSTLGPNVSDILTALNAPGPLGAYFSFSLDSAGALQINPKPGYGDFRLEPQADLTDRAGTGVTFSNFFGVGTAAHTESALNFSMVGQVKSNLSLISLAAIDPTGNPAVNAGDGRGALALQALADLSLQFSQAGALSPAPGRLSEYAGRILAAAGEEAANAVKQRDDRSALAAEIEQRANAVSGVNLDEELSNLILYQNAYNASARIISTTRDLFDTLLKL